MKFTNLENINFYSDSQSDAIIYAEFVIPGTDEDLPNRRRFVKITDSLFASYLRQLVIPSLEGKPSVGEIVQNIKDEIALNGNPDKASPKVRTAGKLADGCLEYDLLNDMGEFVRVTPQRWIVTKKAKHKFLRGNIGLPQVQPTKASRNLFELLRPYVNCGENSFILFVVWLVQSFCEGNHSILLVMAGKGSGKTTLTKMIRSILDPSKAEVSVFPKRLDELTVALTNTYVAAFDNTDELTKEQSNLLCSAVTGATTVKRELYTTNDLCVLTLHNTLIINGIDVVPGESDLADRCLLLKLLPIDAQSRKTDSAIQQQFKADLPEILGAICDVLSLAMVTIHEVAPKDLPRMAESYVEMLAVAVALGITEERFKAIYDENAQMMDIARADIAIVQAVKDCMTSGAVHGNKLSGTMSEVYRKICLHYSGNRQDLPRSVSHFSRKLNAEHATLLAAGYIVNIDPTRPDATHVEIIKK